MYALMVSYYFYHDISFYDKFFNTLFEEAGNDYTQLYDGCILIKPSLTAFGLRQKLIPYLYPDDRLFICGFTPDCAGQLGPKGKEWLQSHIFWTRHK